MAADLVPFVFGTKEVLADLPEHIGEQSIVKIPLEAGSVEFESVETQGVASLSPPRFARLLNLANGVAYGGGMGMPEWVMLDCALIPSFFAGFMGPAYLLTDDHHRLINQGLTQAEKQRNPKRQIVEQYLRVPQGELSPAEWFPIAEFCAIPRVTPQQVMGYSLYSLRRGAGFRSKAFGLWLWKSLGYEYQLGVAQWTNIAAVRTHLRLGVLELLDPMTSMHTKAGDTFIYRLAIPSLDTLRSLIDGHSQPATRLTKPISPHTKWKSIHDLEWWLSKKVENSQRLELHEIRHTSDGTEILISSSHF